MDMRSKILAERNSASTEPDEAYILNRISTDAASGCWVWKGTIGGDGYGKAKRQGRTVRAHRLSYTIYKGPIPVGQFICHSCDNPKCVNPEHLWAGTHHENELDKTNKGRRSPSPPISHPDRIPRGESSHRAKLTASQADAIYRLGIKSTSSKEIISQLHLDATKSAVDRVLSGQSWKHLGLAAKYGKVSPQNIGERNPSTKLTEKDVLEIRSQASVSNKELADKYHVTLHTIRNIKARRTWNHI